MVRCMRGRPALRLRGWFQNLFRDDRRGRGVSGRWVVLAALGEGGREEGRSGNFGSNCMFQKLKTNTKCLSFLSPSLVFLRLSLCLFPCGSLSVCLPCSLHVSP